MAGKKIKDSDDGERDETRRDDVGRTTSTGQGRRPATRLKRKGQHGRGVWEHRARCVRVALKLRYIEDCPIEAGSRGKRKGLT